jgi:3-hydroxy-3-methylglutaryl CoA synthase
MRCNGFTFTQAFEELYKKETTEQMDERTKDLSVEQYKERIEHGVNQWREGLTELARLRNNAFNKFGENIPLENGF